MQLTQSFISQAIPSSCVQGTIPQHSNFCVDSRLLQPGDIFVAIKGERQNGHDFIEQVLHAGAGGIIADQMHQQTIMQKFAEPLKNKFVIFVPDPAQALIDLAHAWRAQFSFPVVAVTGTVGKTTTKEMIRNVLLSAGWQGVVSAGNQNTLIGASMNILKMRASDQVAVFELGISAQGAMRKLVELVRPTLSVITYVGHGHMQGLGSVSQVAQEKREVFALFNEKNIGIINGDLPELAKISYHHPVIFFGKKLKNQIQARNIRVHNNSIGFTAKIFEKKYSVFLSTCNQARVYNALGALAVGKVLGIADEVLIEGIQRPVSIPGRFDMVSLGYGCLMINDAYNANPESMKASLTAFDQYQTPLKKKLVLGDMRELGVDSKRWHRRLGGIISKMSGIHAVILIGEQMQYAREQMPPHIVVHHFAQVEAACDVLKDMLLAQNTVFLLKASLSMRFAHLVKYLQQI
jgi:UDP-N-acetylmuramoyl-tripeptide--D-alanyl-D-alanine ligase